MTNQTKFMVPEDLIIIEKKFDENKIVPCDCLILEGKKIFHLKIFHKLIGSCVVDESKITGESTTVMKYEIPKSNDLFDYNCNSVNFLFKGTEIINCSSIMDENSIKCLVVNTSYNTYQGNMIQNILNDRVKNFKFVRELYIFFFSFLLLVSIVGIYLVFFHPTYCSPSKTNTCLMDYFDGMTILLPAALPISSTFSFLIFHYFLHRNSINCFSEKRLLAASLCNKFIFGKKKFYKKIYLYKFFR